MDKDLRKRSSPNMEAELAAATEDVHVGGKKELGQQRMGKEDFAEQAVVKKEFVQQEMEGATEFAHVGGVDAVEEGQQQDSAGCHNSQLQQQHQHYHQQHQQRQHQQAVPAAARLIAQPAAISSRASPLAALPQPVPLDASAGTAVDKILPPTCLTFPHVSPQQLRRISPVAQHAEQQGKEPEHVSQGKLLPPSPGAEGDGVEGAPLETELASPPQAALSGPLHSHQSGSTKHQLQRLAAEKFGMDYSQLPAEQARAVASVLSDHQRKLTRNSAGATAIDTSQEEEEDPDTADPPMPDFEAKLLATLRRDYGLQAEEIHGWRITCHCSNAGQPNGLKKKQWHPKYRHTALGNFRSIKNVAKALGLKQVAKDDSGAHASGAHVSGAHAGGACASGARASGAHANGACASGAHASDAHASGTHAGGARASGARASGACVRILGAGDKGAGDKGPGHKGEGDKGPGDEGAGDKLPGDKGTGDKGPGYKGPGDKGPGEKGSRDKTRQQAEEGLQQPTQEHPKRRRKTAASASVPAPVLPNQSSCHPLPVDPTVQTQGALLSKLAKDYVQREAQNAGLLERGAATLRHQFESIMRVLDNLSSMEEEKKGINEQILVLQGRAEVAEAELLEATDVYTAQLRYALENEGI